ncbi:MAG: hypothetical protein HQ483_08230 [Rhodospirillales bacterium]|nr:hypothetical protein [Rhodospirillales bacterium]
MEPKKAMQPPAMPAGHRVWRKISPIAAGLRKFMLQFLLPLIAVGPLLIGAEKAAELLGFHGTNTQFIRFLMLGVYGLILYTMMARGGKKPKDTKPTDAAADT